MKRKPLDDSENDYRLSEINQLMEIVPLLDELHRRLLFRSVSRTCMSSLAVIESGIKDRLTELGACEGVPKPDPPKYTRTENANRR